METHPDGCPARKGILGDVLMAEPTEKTEPTCTNCGSTNVRVDAFAEWDADQQKWVLSDTYDNGFCNDCESDLKYFNWKPTS